MAVSFSIIGSCSIVFSRGRSYSKYSAPRMLSCGGVVGWDDAGDGGDETGSWSSEFFRMSAGTFHLAGT